MLLKWLDGHLVAANRIGFGDFTFGNPFLCSVGDDGDGGDGGGSGGGGGGGDGDGGKQDDGKTDFNAQLTAMRSEISGALKTLTSEIAAIKKNGGSDAAVIKELREELAAIKERFQDGGGQQDGDGKSKKTDDGGDAGNEQIRVLERQIKSLTTNLEAQKARADAADAKAAQTEKRNREVERDRLILAAFRAAGGRDDVPDTAVLRTFREDFEFTDDETWLGPNGKDIAAHVKAELPDYMKKPKSSKGGSGGHTPEQGEKPTMSQLKQRAIELGATAHKKGVSSREFTDFEKAKRAYAEAGGDVGEIIDAVSRM